MKKSKTHFYSVGDIVTVFSDPITKEHPIGKAKIIRVEDDMNHRYTVQFSPEITGNGENCKMDMWIYPDSDKEA